MQDGIHFFQVIEIEVGVRRRHQNRAGRDGAAGVEGGMDAMLLQKAKGFGEKFRMQQAFAAGEGHAAAGCVKKDLFGEDGVQDLLGGIFPAAELPGAGGAGLYTGAAEGALAPWKLELPLQLPARRGGRRRSRCISFW